MLIRLSPYMVRLARTSLAAIVAGSACATGVALAGGGPGVVYNDFAQDGVLSCNHPRADLQAVLRSGSINQYGDPLTLARLKLAIRKQLAGGCIRGEGGQTNGTTRTVTTGTNGTTRGRQQKKDHGRREPGRSRSRLPVTPALPASTSGGNNAFFAERGLIAAFLISALALGGWLTKHALAARD